VSSTTVDANRHAGRVALITGAASGIGRASLLRLAQEGASVFGCDVDRDGLDETCAAAVALGGRCDVVCGDLRKVEQLELIVRRALELHGHVDVLANVAGVSDGFVPLHEVSDDEWDRVLDVNLTAAMRLCRAVLPHMREAGGGAIVNVASIAALGGNGGVAYCASKHALLGLSKSIAWMYRDEGIRCNVICPGRVETNIRASARRISDWGYERQASFLALAERVAQPDEIATLLSWLASAEASNMNGAVVSTDGGWRAP
jgi:NAD(P)-dependent dehydrogenase (short-subunit alcohol dehydrogenase family)